MSLKKKLVVEMLVYNLCERATATNGGDDNDGQVFRWTWHLSRRSSIETSEGLKTFLFVVACSLVTATDLCNEVRCGVRLRHGGAQKLCANQSDAGPALVLVWFWFSFSNAVSSV